ncbi:hypothetical protein [Parabacteroides sp. Marseille-P3160]|uniref:hypothetical protein n=1 Tax=Parabacteroides sp. Marseille-P3160 TaxID=1917887 RepID=UPI00111AB7FA|nr:hypothetical protein [Parabacteroides sp. Marseille-P3160]
MCLQAHHGVIKKQVRGNGERHWPICAAEAPAFAGYMATEYKRGGTMDDKWGRNQLQKVDDRSSHAFLQMTGTE